MKRIKSNTLSSGYRRSVPEKNTLSASQEFCCSTIDSLGIKLYQESLSFILKLKKCLNPQFFIKVIEHRGILSEREQKRRQ